MQDLRIAVVGGGHGGSSAVAFLRQFGHTGPITLISEESSVPYQRPPLSKAYLKGDATAASLRLRSETFYQDRDIALRLGTRVVSIDRSHNQLLLDTGNVELYDVLILATGSQPRRLSIAGSDLSGIHVLRDLRDADGIRDEIRPGRRLLVIGGGYVGLECAASARAIGADVTIVERESRILARVACAPLAAFFADYHRANGVKIINASGVDRFEGCNGEVTAAILHDGRRLPCDSVIVGIGADACGTLALDAGLECANGVIVDENSRTSVSNIYAIGDMTWRPMPIYGDRMFRLESVPNAVEQAKRAAADILQVPQAQHEVPWFWSDQYNLKLQIAGVPFDSDDLVVRGSIASGKFAIWHLAHDRLLAVEAVNMPGEFMAGKKLIGKPIDVLRLRNNDLSPKDLA